MEIFENPLVVEILLAVVTALIGIFVAGAHKGINLLEAYLVKKMGLEGYEAAKDFAEQQVRALMQSPAWKDLANPEKKEMALNAVAKWCEDHNVALTFEQMDDLIEAAVQRVKAEFGPETLG